MKAGPSVAREAHSHHTFVVKDLEEMYSFNHWKMFQRSIICSGMVHSLAS